MNTEKLTSHEFGIADLYESSDANLAKRGLVRYLFPKNYKRSIKRHERLGTPVLRKLIMDTIGYPFRRHAGLGGIKMSTNYNMDARMGRMERAADFATKKSVMNETWHTVFAGLMLKCLTDSLDSGVNMRQLSLYGSSLVINLGAVAVQRYNRARIAQYLDRSLERGKRFEIGYTNWLHIDSTSQPSPRLDQELVIEPQEECRVGSLLCDEQDPDPEQHILYLDGMAPYDWSNDIQLD